MRCAAYNCISVVCEYRVVEAAVITCTSKYSIPVVSSNVLYINDVATNTKATVRCHEEKEQ